MVFHQPDIDGEFVMPRDEALGAVERIDQPEARRRASLQARDRCLFLFGDHRDIRRGLFERGDDETLGLFVGQGHGRFVGLVPHVEGRGVNLEDGFRRLARGLARGFEQGLVLGAHRFAPA